MSGILPFSPADYEVRFTSVQAVADINRLVGVENRRIYLSVTCTLAAIPIGAFYSFGGSENGGNNINPVFNGQLELWWYKHFNLVNYEMYSNGIITPTPFSIIEVLYNPYTNRSLSNAVRKPESLAAKIKRYISGQ